MTHRFFNLYYVQSNTCKVKSSNANKEQRKKQRLEKRKALAEGKKKASREREMTTELVPATNTVAVDTEVKGKDSGRSGPNVSRGMPPAVSTPKPITDGVPGQVSPTKKIKVDFKVEEFVWETSLYKKGLFKIIWTNGEEEYVNVRPVLQDKAEEALNIIWNNYYQKNNREVDYIEKIALSSYGKPRKRVMEDFVSLKEYGTMMKWMAPSYPIANNTLEGARYLVIEEKRVKPHKSGSKKSRKRWNKNGDEETSPKLNKTSNRIKNVQKHIGELNMNMESELFIAEKSGLNETSTLEGQTELKELELTVDTNTNDGDNDNNKEGGNDNNTKNKSSGDITTNNEGHDNKNMIEECETTTNKEDNQNLTIPKRASPRKKTKPTTVYLADPDGPCQNNLHKWEICEISAYVKQNKLEGRCIGSMECQKLFVCKLTDAKSEIVPSSKTPVQRCSICMRGICLNCWQQRDLTLSTNEARGRRGTGYKS